MKIEGALLDLPREEQLSERSDIYDVRPEFGWRPWCRVCQKPVDAYRIECNGLDVAFHVECHGDSAEGTLKAYMPWDRFRLEVFCDGDPHMELVPVWWVTINGGEVQLSKSAAAAIVARSGIFTGPFGVWCRAWGKFVGPIVVAVLSGLMVGLRHLLGRYSVCGHMRS